MMEADFVRVAACLVRVNSDFVSETVGFAPDSVLTNAYFVLVGADSAQMDADFVRVAADRFLLTAVDYIRDVLDQDHSLISCEFLGPVLVEADC